MASEAIQGVQAMKRSKSAYRRAMVDAGAVEKQHEPPSPQAIIEARKAQEAASRDPLRYALGEPLPGRSALDKLRAAQRAQADNVIDIEPPQRGRPSQRGGVGRISPARPSNECGSRAVPTRYH